MNAGRAKHCTTKCEWLPVVTNKLILKLQKRIVAKVDELMRWCDALEVRLTAAQTTATHLLDATLRRILHRTFKGKL